jgi:ABC-type glycerol-3-phosphate transport system substrate-binding protein
MNRIGRRSFAIGTAATLAALPGRLNAQELPRRYAGTTLNLLFRSSPAFDATVRLNREFTEATGIELNVTRIAPSDHYAKMMLDVTSGTNAFDVALVLYLLIGTAFDPGSASNRDPHKKTYLLNGMSILGSSVGLTWTPIMGQFSKPAYKQRA